MGKILNIHPSLLPKYPGLHTYQRALENGESEHGTTVHFVNEEIDGGAIVLQAKVPISLAIQLKKLNFVHVNRNIIFIL